MFRFLLFLIALSASAQRPDLSVKLIPPSLLENANAVVRSEIIDITISSRRSINIKTHRVVTVFNKLGVGDMNAYEHRNVKNISAIIYDGSGREIRKLKRKDFIDQAASGESVISDDRVVYLDYTPTTYPYTIVYESETFDSNTAFIPPWQPIGDFYVSVEKKTVSVSCAADLGFRYREYNFGSHPITTAKAGDKVTLTAGPMNSIKREQYAPLLDKYMPTVLFGIDKFHLEGVDGDASTWQSFGQWNYEHLLAGTDELPSETIQKIKGLVGSEKDPMNIAKIVYEFVQNKTRYVSIQLGIGGWKPMLAKDVDRLGYGDCKALTNYTRALLAAVGVDSYYTIVYSNDNKRDLREDFVSVQGNHVMLSLPDGNGLRWLECTSQTAPFGFLGNHIDDRKVLMVRPDGGKLIRTGCFADHDNSQHSTGRYSITADGMIAGEVNIRSKGSQYNYRLHLENNDAREKDLYYKEYLQNIPNLKIGQSKFENDKSQLEFRENLSISAEKYASLEGGKVIFPINAFNNSGHVPQRYRTRTNPFEIERGFVDIDEVSIELPDGFQIEAKPEKMSINGKFGEYTAEVSQIENNKLIYKRRLQINKGFYEPSEYEDYRKFREQIARTDNSKIVLSKL